MSQTSAGHALDRRMRDRQHIEPDAQAFAERIANRSSEETAEIVKRWKAGWKANRRKRK